MLIVFGTYIFQILLPTSATGPPDMVGTFDGGNAMMGILNNYLPNQPMNVDLLPQEGINSCLCLNISILFFQIFIFLTCETGFNIIPSYESHVEPIGAPLVTSSESQLVENANFNIISIEDSESEDENEDGEDNDEYEEEEDDENVGEDEEENEGGDEKDHNNNGESDAVKPSSSKRRYQKKS